MKLDLGIAVRLGTDWVQMVVASLPCKKLRSEKCARAKQSESGVLQAGSGNRQRKQTQTIVTAYQKDWKNPGTQSRE